MAVVLSPVSPSYDRRSSYSGNTKKTNSLGWAASDCHTCQSHKRSCDRRRPRCDACTNNGVLCGGFVQKLDWQRGVASRGKMNRRTLSVAEHRSPSTDGPKPTAFTFVHESGLKQKQDLKRRRSRSDEPHVLPARRKSEPVMCQSLTNPYQLSPQISELLNFYEWRFSVCTLTFDVQVNPWQRCLPMALDTPCLMDAVMALAKRHRAHLSQETEDLEVLELKDRALSSFSAVLDTANPEVMIGTILALIGLEYADSGYSNWTVHLLGAYRVLEAGGGIGLAEQNSSLRSQVAMLAWYDVTSALVSRRGPIFPRSYIEALMAWRTETEWSLLSLNGCPDALFIDLYDIAVAASHDISHEEAMALEIRLWDAQLEDATTDQVTSLLECWRLGLLLYCARVFRLPPRRHFRSRSEVSMEDDESCSPQSSSDNNNERDESVTALQRRKSLAEEILWLVMDLPATSALQKQCLFPVVLAGCEMGRNDHQSFFRTVADEFCKRWKDRSGLWVFQSALDLMGLVWEFMDSEEDGSNEHGVNVSDVWWGDIITSPSFSSSALTKSNVKLAEDEEAEGLRPFRGWLFG